MPSPFTLIRWLIQKAIRLIVRLEERLDAVAQVIVARTGMDHEGRPCAEVGLIKRRQKDISRLVGVRGHA
jgi:hypothetical protein